MKMNILPRGHMTKRGGVTDCMKNKASSSSRCISPMLLTGLFFVGGPFWLYWLIHGNYERTVWILNGPFPFSEFGSAPVQLLMDIISVLIGVGLLVRAIVIWSRKSREHKR